MEFNCRIEMDNAAFEVDPRGELRRVVRHILNRLENCPLGTAEAVRDVNGNTIGQWEIVE